MRPILNTEEQNSDILICDQNTVRIAKSDLDITYMKFHKIFASQFKQNDIFNSLNESIQGFLEGENHSFFAYGQTGAGKTYTMIGEFQESNPFAPFPFLTSEHRGILPRALEKVIGSLKTLGRKCSLMGSFFEVYNEKVYDLLNPKTSTKREGLELRESKDGSNKILDLFQFDIKSVDDALYCLKVGLKNRITGCSHANTKSSRSHSIFQLVLTQEDERNPDRKIISKLRIVDLAGSEKFKIPKHLDQEEKELHISELTSINGSLSTLGHCITALAEPKRTHIPFRNSKLTRVLSDSLSGDSKITFIVCLSPSLESANESISTLQFASRAKKIVLDGRHIKKKEEVLRNNMKLINKGNNVLEVFKQICSDQSLLNQLFDPSMRHKISSLENEIQALKVKNEELQTQVRDLRRSYSPDPSSFLRSSDSSRPSQRRDYKRSSSNNISMRFNDDDDESMDQRSYPVSGVKSRRPSIEKKGDTSFQNNSILDNLSFMKDVEIVDSQKASLSKEEIKRLKDQRANYLKFWCELENSNQKEKQESQPIELISSKNIPKCNLLAQKLKEKEIERKYELFFSLEKQKGSKAESPYNSINMETIPPPNSLTKNVERNNSDPRRERRGQEYFSDKGNALQGVPVNSYKPEQSLSDQVNEYSSLYKRNQTIEEVSEEGMGSERKTYLSSSRADTENDYEISTNERMMSLRLPENIANIPTPKDYNSNGIDIIKEFDKKLSSVHQLNEQHQNLIRNISQKFGAWNQEQNQSRDSPQMMNNTEKYHDSFTNKSHVSSSKSLLQSNSGRDISKVVRDIKQELSDALTQIENLKLGTTPSTQSLNQEIKTEQTVDKRVNIGDRSMERMTWDDVKGQGGHPRLNLSGFLVANNEKANKNQSGSKSIGDIIKKHWSAYKENIQ